MGQFFFSSSNSRVLLLGASGVGKSSLCAQFLSSEHINAYDKVGQCHFSFLSTANSLRHLEFLETRNHDQNHIKHFFATTDNSLIGKRDFRARIFARLAVFYFSSSSNPFLTALTEDSVMKEVSVAVDGEEARISFVDHMHGEMSVIRIMIIFFKIMIMIWTIWLLRTHECDLVLMKI